MAKEKVEKPQSLEKTLWAAADKLIGAVMPHDYMKMVLGLIFLKYVSDRFDAKYKQLVAEGDGFEEEKDAYAEDNVFWIPETARWGYIKKFVKDEKIGTILDQALIDIEKENDELRGILPKVYSKGDVDKRRLGELVDLFSNNLSTENMTGDLFGRCYEYFLGEFSKKFGQKGGEFYTPRCVVDLIVNMIEPFNGRVYDPCCGSGGMFSQSVNFIKQHQQHIVDILGSVDNSIEKSEQIISEIERLIHLQFSVFYGGLTTKSTIGKEFECCLGGTPKTTCPEYWDGNINWINSGEVNKLRICNASKKISQLGMEKSATKLLNRGTTVIAITGATLGQVSLLEIDTCANQSVIGISENQIKKDFIYPLIMHHISDLIKKQTGGAQQHINMNDVKSLEIMVPTLTQYRDYSFEVMPLFDLQSSLCAKIEKMKELKALYLKKFFG